MFIVSYNVTNDTYIRYYNINEKYETSMGEWVNNIYCATLFNDLEAAQRATCHLKTMYKGNMTPYGLEILNYDEAIVKYVMST